MLDGYISGALVEDEYKKLKNKALRILAQREYSAHELRQKLLRFTEAEAVVEKVLKYLNEQNLQDDKRFARSYIHYRSQRGYGPLRLRIELHQRGLAKEVVAEALDQADIDWQSLAEKVRLKRFGGELPKEYIAKMKQKQFLQYRGFEVVG